MKRYKYRVNIKGISERGNVKSSKFLLFNYNDDDLKLVRFSKDVKVGVLSVGANYDNEFSLKFNTEEGKFSEERGIVGSNTETHPVYIRCSIHIKVAFEGAM